MHHMDSGLAGKLGILIKQPRDEIQGDVGEGWCLNELDTGVC